MASALSLSPHPLSVLSLLFLITLCPQGVLSTCRTGTPRECTSAPFVPGHSLSGKGFDLVKMQRAAGLVLDAQKFLGPNHDCNVCENPLMGNKLQKLPLTMSTWSAQSSCDPLSSSVHTSVGSLVGGLTSPVVGSAWGKDLGLSGSTSQQLEGTKSAVASYASAKAGSDKTLFTLHQLSCSQYSYSLYDQPLLHPDFNQQMLSLPKSLTSATLPTYRRFISIYGTHYISQAKLGGRLTRVTSVRQCLASLNKVSVYTVRDCVNSGLSVGLGLLRPSALSSTCRTVLSNRDTVTSYSQGFLDHGAMVTGGNGWEGKVSMTTNDSQGFHLWQDSLRSNPDLVSYSLLPLHSLIPDPIVSANLRTAISEYITQNGITKQPKQPYCNRPNLSSQCCPLHVRRGHLEVTLIRAWGLSGDPVGPTDAYVKIWYGSSYRRSVLIESDNPHWNRYYDFGNVDTSDRLTLQLWDEDVWYDDKLLDCFFYIENGEYNCKCWRETSGFTYSFKLTCDNHLTGSKCHLYRPSLS
ncbi:perforin-1-like [Centroberyx gerrardi]